MVMCLMMCVHIWKGSLSLLGLATVRGAILSFLKIRVGRKILLAFRIRFQRMEICIMNTRFLSWGLEKER